MPSNGETKQPGVLMFTISFDTEKNSLSFIGNMPVEQVMALLQGILQQQQRDAIRKEVESELAQQVDEKKE